MARTGGGREECAHDSHLTRAIDARHAARSYAAGLEPCVNAISTSTPPNTEDVDVAAADLRDFIAEIGGA
jgi:hypothetical protein